MSDWASIPHSFVQIFSDDEWAGWNRKPVVINSVLVPSTYPPNWGQIRVLVNKKITQPSEFLWRRPAPKSEHYIFLPQVFEYEFKTHMHT